ncbi:MAG: DNA polymerase III subunit gamma/tau [Firmicutes bacterium]|nr:DNA polymerase III subunit gamma/tau [Bacillota bacterium]
MPHTALYRKKRPRTFGEVVGQKHIVRALCNQITSGQISHAYLFCGTRGTGKTTIARLFARAINCQNPREGSPCNVCDSCLGILAERNLNVVEIDAASNNGVENIRDLREEVKYQPTQGHYKVYIIDEVHMLSTSAFNALLKTLEEPPSHVIFILATTDSQKLPATILSRCQRYDFRRIAVTDMIDTMKKYLQEEGVQFEESALDYIAYHSDGAMRDALSLLDQSLSLGDFKLTYAQVLDMLGAVDRARLFDFTYALAASDSGAVMNVIDQAMNGGRDASQFTADLIRHFRDVLVASLVNDPNAVDFSAEIAEKLREQGKYVSSQKLMEYIHTFSETLREMRFAPHARTALEVCALRVCVPKVEAVYTPAPAPAVQATAATPVIQPPTPTESKALGDITPDILDRIAAFWDTLCNSFPNPMRAQCAQCGLENNDGKLEIIIGSETMRNIIKPKEGAIREAIAEKFSLSTPPNLAFIVREGYNKPKVQKSEVKNRFEPKPEPEQQTIPVDWITPEPPPEAAEPAYEDSWDAIGDEISSDNKW